MFQYVPVGLLLLFKLIEILYFPRVVRTHKIIFNLLKLIVNGSLQYNEWNVLYNIATIEFNRIKHVLWSFQLTRIYNILQ